MPRMNGFELAQNIRRHSLYGKVPMVAFSSRADENFVNEGRKSGFNMYLEKQKPEELIKAVRYLTEQVRSAS